MKRIGGRLCLDFANTVGGFTVVAPDPRFEVRDERLHDYDDLLAWAALAQVVDEPTSNRLWRQAETCAEDAAAVLGRARRLREALYRIGWQLARGSVPPASDLGVLQEELRMAREPQRLVPAAHGLAWKLVGDPRALDQPLWPVALDADEYFTRGDLSRLHACPGDECGWLFEDTTRNRSRQWCDMGDCGNVAKARRFRSRHGS